MSDELGTLVIVVLKAQNLKDIHSFYKQDVYAQLSLNGKKKSTPVDKKGGQHPLWDAEIRYSISKEGGEKNRVLEVSCWASEPKVDEVLGTGKVDITETLKTGEFDGMYHLCTTPHR
jgi:Ca2+-dependent lipid-binding protein